MLPFDWMSSTRHAASLLLVLSLAGCAGLGERRDAPADISDPGGEAVEPTQPDPARTDPTPPEAVPTPEPTQDTPAGAAHTTLLASAQQARTAGDSARAIALLERAQRIDPDNGALYLELARTHFDAGNIAQARATAERGLLYCRRDECAALRALIDRSLSDRSRS